MKRLFNIQGENPRSRAVEKTHYRANMGRLFIKLPDELPAKWIF